MQLKSKTINIDGIPFKIYENLGEKGLAPPEELKALGTFIGELRKDYGEGLRTDLKKGKYIATNAISLMEVSSSDQDKARSFWRRHSDQEPKDDWVAIYVADMPWHAYLPHSTLLKIVAQVEQLLSEETLAPEPPWLFRENPIASYACRKEPYEGLEEQMLRTLDERLSEFQIDNQGLLSDPTTGQELNGSHEFVQRLKFHGLFSSKENLMKLDELQQWGLRNLEDYYKKWLGNPKKYSAARDQTLESMVARLFKLLSMESSKQDDKILIALRNKVLIQLSQMGYLDELKSKEGCQIILEQLGDAPNLKHYVRAIGFLWEYIYSAERGASSNNKEVSDILDFPVSVEWFLHNRPPQGYSPFAWLANCEKEIYTAKLDRDKQLFKKVDGKSFIFYIANEDGIIPKLIRYKISA